MAPFLTFGGLNDTTISGVSKIWWKEVGYGNCKLSISINNKVVNTSDPDINGFFSYEFDTRKYNDGNYTIKATLSNSGRSKTISKIVTIKNGRFFDFWGYDENSIVSNYGRIWWKEVGYGDCKLSLKLDNKNISTFKPDENGIFSWTLDTTNYADGVHTVKAVLINPSGTQKELQRRVIIKNSKDTDTESADSNRPVKPNKPNDKNEPGNKDESEDKKSDKDVTVPGKPVLSITNTSASTIKIKWTKSKNASGYVLYRRQEKSKKFKKIANINSSKASYTDRKTKAGTVYQYKIVAYRSVNGKKYYGKYSQILTAYTKMPKVILTTAKKNKSKQVQLKWKVTSKASGYEVYRALSPKGKYKKIATVKNANYIDKKLKSKTKYYYKIHAYRKVNKEKIYGAYSSVKMVKTK